VVEAELALVAEVHDLFEVGRQQLLHVSVHRVDIQAIEHHLERRAERQAAPTARVHVIHPAQLGVDAIELPEVRRANIARARTMTLEPGPGDGTPPPTPVPIGRRARWPRPAPCPRPGSGPSRTGRRVTSRPWRASRTTRPAPDTPRPARFWPCRGHLGVLVGLAGHGGLEVLLGLADRLAGRRIAHFLPGAEVAEGVAGLGVGGVLEEFRDVREPLDVGDPGKV